MWLSLLFWILLVVLYFVMKNLVLNINVILLVIKIVLVVLFKIFVIIYFDNLNVFI